MKTLLIFLLLCWLSSADGLKCYSCMATNNNICNRYTAPCEAPHDTCMSIVEKTGNHKTIIKKCATSDFCSLATSGASIAQAVTNIEPPIVTCCSTDLWSYFECEQQLLRSMRTLLILLLLCWLGSADGLKCYSCMDTDNAACNRYTAPCQALLDTCMSIVESIGNQKKIIKYCVTSDFCSQANSTASIIQEVTNIKVAKVTCCSTDLCNYSGATTARLHTLLLALPLCVTSALCYVSA